MSTQPIVSVIMAVHNGMPYLPEAVESILTQSLTNFEFIIVDDGSTDGSGDWLEGIAKTDPRVKLLRQPHRGLTPSLNIALNRASGDYIARMDADDVSKPQRLKTQVEFMASNSDVICSGTWAETIDAEGESVGTWCPPIDHREIDSQHLNGLGGGIIHPSAIFRRASYELVGGYRTHWRYAQDYDLWLRFAEIGRLANLPVCLISYRRSASQITMSRSHEQNDCVRRIQLDALVRRTHLSVPVTFLTYLRTSCSHSSDAAKRILRNTFPDAALRLSIEELSNRPFHFGVWVSLVASVLACLRRKCATVARRGSRWVRSLSARGVACSRATERAQ
jgi:glycosyltransferase involved in cell wall biosynthesis